MLSARAEHAEHTVVRAKTVVEADKRCVSITGNGGDEMKIPARSGKVWLRNKGEQLRGRGINAGKLIVQKRRVRCGIDQLDRVRPTQQAGEISRSFGECGDGRELIKGVGAAAPGVVAE